MRYHRSAAMEFIGTTLKYTVLIEVQVLRGGGGGGGEVQ